jgi:sugar O-acyltransferase (sialic acid O-acetyltransferase NeuD family)
MNQRLAIVGGGGFGREVLDVVEAINAQPNVKDGESFSVVGFLDDGQPELGLLEDYGLGHLGPINRLAGLPADVGYVIAIGSVEVRRRIDEYGQTLGRNSPVLLHPTVSVGRKVEFGPGTVVCAHASITNHIRLGRHVHVNLNSTIGHDTEIGNYVTISPLVALSGGVTVGDSVFLGTGSTINQGLTLSRGAVVGAGAAVIRDVAENSTVVGVPAKPR